MNNEVTTQVGPSNTPQNGYTGRGQNQMFASGIEQATLAGSIDKGGMRGLGLIAVALAEAKLKYETYQLAKKYYDINKKDYDFFVSVHEPAIAQSVTEVMSDTTNPKYPYDLYASVPAGIAKTAIADKQWFQVRRNMHRYALGAQKRVDYEFAIARTHAIVAGWNIGTRYEITYADEHNNRRFDRKIAMSNVGIGVGNIVRQGLSSAVAKLASAQDTLGDTISTIGNGLAARSGYVAARNQTRTLFKTDSGYKADTSKAE